MIKVLKWLSVFTTIGMLFVLIGGALVTKTGSGDGCGASWPLCNGQFIPSQIDLALIIELSHRLVSGSVGIFVLLVAALAWKYFGHVREVKFLSLLSVSFLLLQGLLGAAAVIWGQSDFALAAHFGVSLISFASIFLLMLLIFEIDRKFDADSLHIKKKHRIEIYALSIYTLLVVYTGALVRHAKASLACTDWPFCFNTSPFDFASFGYEQWIQMGHRLAAGTLFIWTLSFFIRVLRQYRSKVMVWGWITTFSLIVVQVLLGAMIIFTLLNLTIALFHALVITCYFGMLSYFILLSTRSAAKERKNLTIDESINSNIK